MFAFVDGQKVKVGDTVCFKSDVEQCGRITKINTNAMGSVILTLHSEYGFHGDYIGGEEYTTERAQDCWVE